MRGIPVEKRKVLIPVVLVGLTIIAFSLLFFAVETVPVKKHEIAVIELKGELVSSEEPQSQGQGNHYPQTTTGEFHRAFEKARRDDGVKAVVLLVDSPGGTVQASYEMYSTLKRFDKPVVAFIRGSGVSGAYLVSLGADKVVAHPFSRVGSIGAYIPLERPVPLQPEEAEETLIISSGAYKTLWEDGVLDKDERRFLQMKVEETKNSFFKIVFNETRLEKTDVEDYEENPENPKYQLVEGGWFNGDKAFELGLIGIKGNMEDTLKTASNLAKIKYEETQTTRIEPPPPGTYEYIPGTTHTKHNETLPIYLKQPTGDDKTHIT